MNGRSTLLMVAIGALALPLFAYAADSDTDRLPDDLEALFQSDPQKYDTDGDGYDDFTEVMSGHDPLSLTPEKIFKREIVVDRTKQHTYFRVNNIDVLELPVSTGNPGTPTPAGEFSVLKLIPVHQYAGIGYTYKNVKWNIMFKPKFYLHTAYWHNDFGKSTRSHGCVNMKEADAALLYKFVEVGMPVRVVGETPRRLVGR